MLADDDPPNSPAARKLGRAIEGWRNGGFKIAVATLLPDRRGDKSDFNDTLKADGPDAVLERIELALAGIFKNPVR